MRELLLLRHAEAAWGQPPLPDHERPLTPKGLDDATRAGDYLAAQGQVPDLIVCSSARRTQETARRLFEGSEGRPPLHAVDGLYLAEPSGYLDELSNVDPGVRRVLLVGHNPSIETLVTTWCGPTSVPPGFLGAFAFDSDGWDISNARPPRLQWQWTP